MLLNRTLWSASGTVSFLAGRFIAGIVVARLLGPYGAGRISYLLWIADMASVIAGFGLQSTITRFCANLDGKGQPYLANALARLLSIRFLIFSFSGLCCFAFIGVLNYTFSSTITTWVLLGAYYFLGGIGLLFNAFLAGKQRFALIAKINGLSSLTLVLGAIIGSEVAGIPGAIGAYALAALIPAAMSVSIFRTGDSSYAIPRDLVSKANSYSFYAWASAMLSSIVWSRAEVFFLEHYRGSYEVAMFTVAATLASLVVQGPLLLCGALMPWFAEQAGASNRTEMNRIFASATRLLAAVVVPISLGITALIPVLLPAIYGERFQAAVPVATLLIPAAGILSIASPASQLIYGLGKAWFHFVANLPFAVLMVLGCIVVTPHYGAWGAACIRACVQGGMLALAALYISRTLCYSIPWREIGLVVVISIVSGLLLSIFVRVVHIAWTYPFACFIFAVLYSVAVCVTNAITTTDRQLVIAVGKMAIHRLFLARHPCN